MYLLFFDLAEKPAGKLVLEERKVGGRNSEDIEIMNKKNNKSIIDSNELLNNACF